MKKQLKKLSLNKKTISNLNAAEMKNLVGGNETNGLKCTRHCTVKTYDWCPSNSCKGYPNC